MAVIDLVSYKALAGLSSGTTPFDAQISALCLAADAEVKNYCKRLLETTTITEYRDGSTQPSLALYQRPVRFVVATGSLTASSAVVTGLSTTTGLIVGMPVCVQLATTSPGNPAIPVGTTILSIGTGTVTLSQNAVATVPATPLVFGLAVYLDSGGYYGQGIGGFASMTQLFLGTDFVCKVDQPDGSSKCGLLYRMGAGITGNPLGGFFGAETRQGSLTARRMPIWCNWYGNVLINYTAGLGTNPQASGGTIPADITAAAALIVSAMRRQIKVGGQIASESLGAYSYSLHYPTADEPPELGTARQILSRYREVAW